MFISGHWTQLQPHQTHTKKDKNNTEKIEKKENVKHQLTYNIGYMYWCYIISLPSSTENSDRLAASKGWNDKCGRPCGCEESKTPQNYNHMHRPLPGYLDNSSPLHPPENLSAPQSSHPKFSLNNLNPWKTYALVHHNFLALQKH